MLFRIVPRHSAEVQQLLRAAGVLGFDTFLSLSLKDRVIRGDSETLVRTYPFKKALLYG